MEWTTNATEWATNGQQKDNRRTTNGQRKDNKKTMKGQQTDNEQTLDGPIGRVLSSNSNIDIGVNGRGLK